MPKSVPVRIKQGLMPKASIEKPSKASSYKKPSAKKQPKKKK